MTAAHQLDSTLEPTFMSPYPIRILDLLTLPANIPEPLLGMLEQTPQIPRPDLC